MKRIVLSFLIISIVVGIDTSCTPINAQVTPDYEHVIILGFDGWGASSFNDANMPFLKSLLPEVHGPYASVMFYQPLVHVIGLPCLME